MPLRSWSTNERTQLQLANEMKSANGLLPNHTPVASQPCYLCLMLFVPHLSQVIGGSRGDLVASKDQLLRHLQCIATWRGVAWRVKRHS